MAEPWDEKDNDTAQIKPDLELAKDDSERSPYLTEALNYLCKFRDWRYLGEFFQKIFNGCPDFFSLTLANMGMAYANC